MDATTYSSAETEDMIIFYFNLFEWSATKGTLRVDSGTLHFNSRKKSLEIPLPDITEARFAYYLRYMVPRRRISYRLLLKTTRGNFRIHFQQPETQQKLLTIFQEQKITIKGAENNTNLQKIESRYRKGITTLIFAAWILGLMAVVVGFVFGQR